MRRRFVLAPTFTFLAAACGGGSAAGSDVSAVAAVYPLAWVAEQVAPEAQVSLLSAGGVEAHDLELSPGQRGTVETADVVLFVGDIDYQPQVEEAVESATGEVLSLVEIAGPDRLLEAGEDEAHADEVAGEPAEEEGDEAAVDAHLWFDAGIMADVAARTGEAFAAADPDNAGTYRANAEAVRGELAELGEDLKEMLEGPCRHNEAIVSHEAYGYLLEPFGHTQHGVTGINPEAGASSAEMGEMVEEIEREGFVYVLTEPVEGREGAEAVAREAGVELLEVSPLDAISPEHAESGFPALLRQQAGQFRTALGCS